MQYQVKQQFGRNPENQLAEFGNLTDAKHFLFEKLSSDAMYKINAIYRIYHYGEEMIEEWDQQKWQKEADAKLSQGSNDSSSGAGAGAQSGFRPTPLPTSPRPPGMPASQFKENDEDEGIK